MTAASRPFLPAHNEITSYHIAAAAGDAAHVVSFLKKYGKTAVDVQCGDSIFPLRTALMWAAREGQDHIISLLANNGANLDALDEDGTTALMQAVYCDRIDAAHALLACGAHPAPISKSGICERTPLLEAIIRAHSDEMIHALLAGGVPLDAESNRQDPESLARLCGYTDIADMIAGEKQRRAALDYCHEGLIRPVRRIAPPSFKR